MPDPKAPNVSIEDLRRRLAANAAARRRALGYSQSLAASRAELHLRTYQRIEEATINVTIALLTKVARALQCDPVDLLREPSASGGLV